MSSINLKIRVSEENANQEQIDELTRSMLSQIEDYDVEHVNLLKNQSTLSKDAKGDPTIGAIVVGIATASIPSLLAFFQHWTGDKRKISLEAPNGAKIEFTPDRQYSKEELLKIVDELNKI